MAKDKKPEPAKEIVEEVHKLRKAVDEARETIREIKDERDSDPQAGR